MFLYTRFIARFANYKSLLALALPVALQTAIFSSKSTVDLLMLGTLSELDIAAIGLAAKAQMIISFFIIGLSIGGGQIAAQCFGIKNAIGQQKLNTTVLITLLLSLSAALVFFILLVVFPSHLMALGTQSQDIIDKGVNYLQTIAISLFCFAYASSIACGLRAMHQPSIATKVSFLGVILNLFFNWVLIFGHFGFPAMGIKGAALGTVLSAIIECVILYLYLQARRHPLAQFNLHQIKSLRVADITLVTRLSITAAVNSIVWAAGLFMFHAILGYSDPNLLVALSVLAPVEALAMSLLIGLATAGSVLIGNVVGADQREKLPLLIRRHIVLSACVGIVTAFILFVFKSPLLGLFFHSAVPSEAAQMAGLLYQVMAISLIIKSVSMMLIVGVLRAGGDANFCLITDILAQWVFLLPVAFWLTHIVGLSAIYLFGLIIIEESLKIALCLWRLHSDKWVKNLVTSIQ